MRAEYTNYLEFCVGDCSSICEFNHLLISVWIHGSGLYTLGYKAAPLHFVGQLVPALAIGSAARCYGPVVVGWGEHVLTVWPTGAPGSACVFPAQTSTSQFSEEPGSPYWRVGFRSQDLGTQCTCCSEVSLPWVLSADRTRTYMCVCSRPFVPACTPVTALCVSS